MRNALTAALIASFTSPALASQPPAPTPLDWAADDSARIAFVTQHGQTYRNAYAIVWAPKDSVDAHWLAAFTDSLGHGLAQLKRLVGGPYAWGRFPTQPITYYLSAGHFIAHATGRAAVFISLYHVRRGQGAYPHEAAHELLAPPAPFFPDEFPDSATQDDAAAHFPEWLSEGLPDYLAQASAAASGFREGDVFDIGGLTKVDSSCAARAAAGKRSGEILAAIGGPGQLPDLFTTERREVTPIFYTCSQSFTKFLVNRVGLRTMVALFPHIQSRTWEAALASAAGRPLAELRREWMKTLGLPSPQPP